MSHFLVLVVGENPKEQLAAFHEFECTGIDDKYVQDLDVTEEVLEEYENSEITKLQAPDGKLYGRYDDFFYRDATEEEVKMIKEKKISNWQKTGDGNFKIRDIEDFVEKTFKTKGLMTFKEFYENDYDGEFILEGEKPDLAGDHKYRYGVLNKQGELIKIIKRTNPNARWDWYQVGGRWSGELKLKKGCDGTMGEKSWLNLACEDKPGYCDSTLKKHIDIEGMEEPMRIRAEKIYDEWHGGIKNLPDDSEEKKKWLFENLGYFVSKSEVDMLNTQTRDEYVSCNSCYAPFALLWEGRWYEKGDMGWWGIVSDEDSNWKGQFKELWNEIPDDELITVVDCHI